MRGDTQRNRRQLIKAAAELFENSPTPVSLAEIAKRAEVSTARRTGTRPHRGCLERLRQNTGHLAPQA